MNDTRSYPEGAEAMADKLDAIFDRIEVSCNWRLSSEERRDIAKAAKVLRTFTVAQTKPDLDEPREVTSHWQRRWPHDQPNGWNLDGAGFLKLIQENPLMWLACTRAKYLEMRIDTRDGGFNLYDRDKKPLNPDDVIDAINKVRKDFGDTAVSSTNCTCGGSPDQPQSHHDISCPLSLPATDRGSK